MAWARPARPREGARRTIPERAPEPGGADPIARLAYRVAHEFLRYRLTPGAVEFAAPPETRWHAGIEHVGIGPVLVHPAPLVAPIVEYLAAERMAPDTPEMLVAPALHVLVAAHDVIDVGGL